MNAIRDLHLKYGECYKCHHEVRVGLLRCPECATWLHWDRKGQSGKLRIAPVGNLWGKIDFRGLPQLNALDEKGHPAKALVPDERVYIVTVAQDLYILDGGLMIPQAHCLISHHQLPHGRINYEAAGHSSLDTAFWDPEKSKSIRDLVPITRVQIFTRENGFCRIGEGEWVWEGFIDQIIAVGTVKANALGHASLDNPEWNPGISIEIEQLKPGSRVEIFDEKNGYFNVGGAWVWHEFVHKERNV